MSRHPGVATTVTAMRRCTVFDSDLIIDTTQRINHANELSRSVRLTARMLLDLVDQHGYIRMEYDAALQVTEIDEVGTLRGHLSQLKSAGILALYHLNGAVDITFAGFPTRALRAEMIAGRARARVGRAESNEHAPTTPPNLPQNNTENVNLRAPFAREVAIFVQQRAEDARTEGDLQSNLYISHAPAPALVGWLADTTPSTPGLLFEPTNQPNPDKASQAASLDAPGAETLPPPPPASTATSQLDPVEQAMSYSLLLAVRMIPANAKRLSRSFRFETIREAVAWWEMNRQSQGGRFEETPGIVVRWLDTPDKFAVPRLDPAWLQSEFGRRWRTKAEIEAEQQEQQRKEEERAWLLAEKQADLSPDPVDEPPQEQLDELWTRALDALVEHLPAVTVNTWLGNTRLRQVGGQTVVVAASNYAAAWIAQNLISKIRRQLVALDLSVHQLRVVADPDFVSRPAG